MRRAVLLCSVLALGVTACGDRSGSGAPAEDEAVPVPAESDLTAPELGDPILARPDPAAGAGGASDGGSAVPAQIEAIGTEPFWNARINGTGLMYTTPEDMSGQRGTLSRRDTARGTVFDGKLGEASVHMEVMRQRCTNGMSDRVYPYTAVLTIGTEQRSGCAFAPG